MRPAIQHHFILLLVEMSDSHLSCVPSMYTCRICMTTYCKCSILKKKQNFRWFFINKAVWLLNENLRYEMFIKHINTSKNKLQLAARRFAFSTIEGCLAARFLPSFFFAKSSKIQHNMPVASLLVLICRKIVVIGVLSEAD